MDFLDSLDLQAFTHVKKTDRMRSWYLYEQYKTLEQHQLDAAQTLRNRSLQERLLQRELSERRARRSIYDQISFAKSEPKIDRSQATCLSTTADDFYESFCELHDFEIDNSLDRSHHGSETYMDDSKTIDDSQEDTSCADSIVSSVVNKNNEATNVSAQRTIAENIKQHLQTVKKNMVSLEKYARMADALSEESVDSLGWPKTTNVLRKDVDDNQLFCAWSRLVAFAYHIIQLNHGNCYYDYSSQVLTAVLACDALRRGVNRMCDILQYYVSPIKFAESEDGSSVCNKIQKSYVSKKMRKTSKYKVADQKNCQAEGRQPYIFVLGQSICISFILPPDEINSSVHKKCFTKRCEESCTSGKLCQQHKKSTVIRRMQEKKKRQPMSRKWPRAKRTSSVSRSLRAEDLEYGDFHQFRRGRVVNPMLQLVRYLDDVLKADMEYSTYYT